MSEHLKPENEHAPAAPAPKADGAAQSPAASSDALQPQAPADPQPQGDSGEAPAGGAPADADRDAKRPRRGRVAIEFAECSLGEIMNVSPTGLRARYKGPRKNLPEVDQRFGMQVQTPDGPVQVRARVAWTKRVRLRAFDIGVEFVAAEQKDAVKLKQLAAMAGRSIVINETTGGAHLRAG